MKVSYFADVAPERAGPAPGQTELTASPTSLTSLPQVSASEVVIRGKWEKPHDSR